MKRKRTQKAERSHKTFRIHPEILVKTQGFAKTTGWSEAKVVNALLKASLDGIAGIKDAISQVKEAFEAAEDLELARQKSERLLAPLRKKAAEARLALRPLVQKIKQHAPKATAKAA